MHGMTRLLPVLLALAVGCDDGADDWFATFGDQASPFTDAEGIYRGPTQVHRVYLDCRGDGPWEYGAFTYGWATRAEITTNQWYPRTDETHPLPSVDRGDDNQWDHRYVALDVVPPGSEPGERETALGCDWSFYTWRVRVWDAADVESDCVVFGYDPDVVDPARRCRLFPLQAG